MNRLRDKCAFTLVEMLVVIAIISVLTAIAVPTLNRLGVFGRDPLTVASSQLLYMLKAARIYAGAHNVDAAVAYSIGPHKDSMNATDVPVMDGAAIVRRLTPREMELLKQKLANMVSAGAIDQTEADNRIAWATAGCEDADPDFLPFVPVKGTDGVFTPLSRGAVLAPREGVNQTIVTEYRDLPAASWGLQDWGLSPIRVVNDELMPIEPRVIKGSSPRDYYDYLANAYGGLPARFPAHVFKPSGVLQTPGSEKARFTITVVPAPEAPQNARFLENGQPVPAEQLEIYSTIGRIQAAS